MISTKHVEAKKFYRYNIVVDCKTGESSINMEIVMPVGLINANTLLVAEYDDSGVYDFYKTTTIPRYDYQSRGWFLTDHEAMRYIISQIDSSIEETKGILEKKKEMKVHLLSKKKEGENDG